MMEKDWQCPNCKATYTENETTTAMAICEKCSNETDQHFCEWIGKDSLLDNKEEVGGIGNYYGGLHITKYREKYYWIIEDHSTEFHNVCLLYTSPSPRD